ncbi:hypothetical protein, partial [Serratia plymuthica]|uniref:hypothetical protein n=1 Tax=Serratia plymuthica TaxID=82996 RepID=UPI000968F558
WWLIILVCIAFFVFTLVKKDLSKIKAQENIHAIDDLWLKTSEGLNEIKKQRNLPLRINQYTVFKDMFIKNHEIHYIYSVSNLPMSDEVKGALYEDALAMFQKDLCRNPLILEYGGQMVLTYQFLTGDLVYKYTKSSCLK